MATMWALVSALVVSMKVLSGKPSERARSSAHLTARPSLRPRCPAVDQGAPLVDVMVVLVAGGRHRVADHGALPVECVRRNPGASRLHQVAVLHCQLGRRLLPHLDLEVAGRHLDADLVLQGHVRRRQVLGHRPDHGPDPVVLVMGSRLGGQPIEQRGVGGQVEPTFDLGVGQGVAHALGEGSVPVRPVDADPCLGMADAAAQRRHPGVGVGREPGADAASLVGRVHPDPDARDLEVVAQGSGDHQLTGHHLARERAVALAELTARAGGEEHRHAVLAGVERGLASSARSAAAYTPWKASMSASLRGSTGRITISLTRATVSWQGSACKRIVGVSGPGSNTCSG